MASLMPLSNVLQDNMDRICQKLYIGRANFDTLVEKVQRCEIAQRQDYYDEQVWTFLLAAGYAVAGDRGVTTLGSLLTEDEAGASVENLWFECLPIPPRMREGNTHLDLALGAIARRPNTQSGIEYLPASGDFICFCEFKWYSDISIDVYYDMHRNQLARVIENALCFQRVNGRLFTFPKSVHVTLITPAVFQQQSFRSRLYQYKFWEYRRSSDQLIADLHACCLTRRNDASFQYPVLEQRVGCLRLHWVSFESLRERVPDSVLTVPFQEFWSKHGPLTT
jgi:hypothetical protein